MAILISSGFAPDTVDRMTSSLRSRNTSTLSCPSSMFCDQSGIELFENVISVDEGSIS